MSRKPQTDRLYLKPQCVSAAGNLETWA